MLKTIFDITFHHITNTFILCGNMVELWWLSVFKTILTSPFTTLTKHSEYFYVMR